jgi:hypothetical protein
VFFFFFFFFYNEGRGIRDDTPNRVYKNEPDTETEYIVAQWK